MIVGKEGSGPSFPFSQIRSDKLTQFCELDEHRDEVEAEADDHDPEHADECHESPNVLQLHTYYSKSRDHVQRLNEVGALVTIYECVQAVEEVCSLDSVYSTYDERSLYCELSTL